MDVRTLWFGPGPGPRMARTLLTPMSWLYATGWQTYRALYDLGLKQAKAPHRPVLVIGNLTTGGSGKSPLVLHVADVLRGLGKEVVIGASGYGSPRAEGATLAPSGPLDASEWGDEPAMLREAQADLPLVVGRRRVLAAEIVHRHHPDAVLLMDDGFQHLPLRKHLAILLDEPHPTNARCLPAGPYREPRRNRRRADLVLPGDLRIDERFEGLRTPEGEPRDAVSVQVLCALGRPDRLLSTLKAAGMTVERTVLAQDHDPLDAGNLFAPLSKDLPVIVTAKDWVKLRRRSDLAGWDWLIARHSVTVEPADAFRRWLQEKLDGIA